MTQKRKTGLLGCLIFLILVSCAGIVTVGVIFQKPGSRATNYNAKCLSCGQEFSISEKYRGNASEYTVFGECPRCGQQFPVIALYKEAEAAKKEAAKSAAPPPSTAR